MRHAEAVAQLVQEDDLQTRSGGREHTEMSDRREAHERARVVCVLPVEKGEPRVRHRVVLAVLFVGLLAMPLHRR